MVAHFQWPYQPLQDTAMSEIVQHAEETQLKNTSKHSSVLFVMIAPLAISVHQLLVDTDNF